MKRKLLAALLAMFGATLSTYGASLICVVIVGPNPVRLWTTAHTHYLLVPHVTSYTLPVGAGLVIAGLMLAISSLRLWSRPR